MILVKDLVEIDVSLLVNWNVNGEHGLTSIMVLLDVILERHVFLHLEEWLCWRHARLEVEAPDLVLDFVVSHGILKCGKVHLVLVDNSWFGDRVPVVQLVVVP